MGIVFRHDAAGVVPPSNSATRKYGQQLVLQQNQQKYAAQQAGYDRMLQLGRDAQQNQFQLGRDNAQQAFIQGRDKAQNDFMAQRQDAQRRQAFMDEARKLNSGMIMDDIKNGFYDPATARKLQQSLAAEADVLGSDQYDATQRAEALNKIREKRLLDSMNRLEPPPKPTPEEEMNAGVVTRNGVDYQKNAKGVWEPLPLPQPTKEDQQKQKEAEQLRPKSVQEYYSANEEKFQKDLDATMKSMQAEQDLITDPTVKKTPVTPESAWERMQKDYDFRQKALGRPQHGDPAAAPGLSTTPTAPGQSRSILDAGSQSTIPRTGLIQPIPNYVPGTASVAPIPNYAPGTASVSPIPNYVPPAQSPAPAPQAPAAEPTPVDRTIEALQSAMKRELTPQEIESVKSWTHPPETAGAAPPTSRQQVNVGGKPLVVTPGTLTPQETAARQQIMGLPIEQRIAALMPYDPNPELKGKTLEQLLADPATKAGYDELTKQGLTTGNYREDMLKHLDDMLQQNVLNASGTPQDAYVGMRADEVTNPKAKAEVAKMPRPKTPKDMMAITGPYFIDPDGIIRVTKK